MKRVLIPLFILLTLTACGTGGYGYGYGSNPPVATDPANGPLPTDPSSDGSLATPELTNPDQPSGIFYTVYFTDPDGPNSDSLRGGPDAHLAAAIDAARVSVDIAIFELNLWSIRDALLNAHQRGVAVRVAAESDYLEEPEMEELIAAGIPVVDDVRQGLMHNKFAVIDGYQVWTGSMNFTMNGAYHNNNNLVLIESTRLAASYTAEFEEMFIMREFGDDSPTGNPHPALNLDGITVEVFFSPDDGAQARIVQLLNNAQQSIFFMAFAYTADPIGNAMIDAKARGLDVAGIVEARQNSNQGSEFERLIAGGVEVHTDGNQRMMHHKVIIIDGQIVIFGSYNFSASAEDRNDENLLIVFDVDFANLFLDEFDRVYAKATQ